MKSKERRSLVINGYIDQCIERLQLARIVNDPEITCGISDEVWAKAGRPLVAYAYSVRPFWTLANFTQASKKCRETVNPSVCRCSEARFTPFVDSKLGHAVTTDPAILDQYGVPELAELARKGTKHRTMPAALYPLQDPEHGPPLVPPGGTVADRITAMVSTALTTFFKNNLERHGVDRAVFETEYADKVLTKVSEFNDSLTAVEIGRLQQATSDAPLTQDQLKVLKETVHDELVIGEADKESDRYTFVCRALHDEWLLKEADGADSNYSPTLEPESSVMKRIYDFCERNDYLPRLAPTEKEKEKEKEMKRKFTNVELFTMHQRWATLYVAIKTHKSPMKARFVAGGTKNPAELPCKWLHRILWKMKPYLDTIHSEITRDAEATHLEGRFATSCLSS